MSTESGSAASRLVVRLRDGQTCEMSGDRIVAGSQEYPFADVAWAGLVVDPNAPMPPGAPLPPALLLRLRDGRDVLLAPAEPPAAWQLLGAVHAARPDLRFAGAPQWAPPPPGYAAPPGYAPPGYGYYPRSSTPSSNDTVLAGLAHLSVFFGGFIFPLIIWLTTRTSNPYASRQAKQAFFWQLLFGVAGIVLYIVFFAVFFVGFFNRVATAPIAPNGAPIVNPFVTAPFAFVLLYLLFFAGYIIDVVFSIIGAVKGFQGKPFHYPLLGGLH